jgi:hypothetical protein
MVSKYIENMSYILCYKKERIHVYLEEVTSDNLFLRNYENKDDEYISCDYVLELDKNGKIENKYTKMTRRGILKLEKKCKL